MTDDEAGSDPRRDDDDRRDDRDEREHEVLKAQAIAKATAQLTLLDQTVAICRLFCERQKWPDCPANIVPLMQALILAESVDRIETTLTWGIHRQD